MYDAIKKDDANRLQDILNKGVNFNAPFVRRFLCDCHYYSAYIHM